MFGSSRSRHDVKYAVFPRKHAETRKNYYDRRKGLAGVWGIPQALSLILAFFTQMTLLVATVVFEPLSCSKIYRTCNCWDINFATTSHLLVELVAWRKKVGA
jgi:hypothetical protein